MLDRDLAMVYGVETRALNQQRERNPEKFPEDFAYQLTGEELDSVTFESQNVIQTSISKGRRGEMPWAYTLEVGRCN
jgi:hypothetical protein